MVYTVYSHLTTLTVWMITGNTEHKCAHYANYSRHYRQPIPNQNLSDYILTKL